MISVVIPLFNKAPHVAKAIESVLEQSVKPLELIIIDDGSEDNGKAVVEKYIGNGVHYFFQENQGVSAARNRGIELASGEFIAFLDADDWWLPNHIKVLLELITAFPRAKLYSTSYYIKRGQSFFRPENRYKYGWMGYVEDFFLEFSFGLSLVNSITACSRRADLIAVQSFPLKVKKGEDIVCWLKLAMLGKVAHAEIPTAVYYQDGVNRSNKLKYPDIPGSILYLSELINKNKNSCVNKKSLNLLFEKISFYTIAGFVLDGNYFAAKQIFSFSLRQGKYWLALKSSALFLVPRKILILSREYRHRKEIIFH